MRRNFLIALLLSALLHLIVLAAPGWHIGNLFADNAAPLLEAQLLAPMERPQPVARPAPRKKMHEAPTPAPVPDTKPAPAEILAAADSPAVAEAQGATAAAPEPAAEPIVAAVPEVAPPLPRSGHIRFLITRGEGGFVVGQSIHEWHHDGKHYSLNATAETTGLVALFKPAKAVQSSEGGFSKGELKPENFRYDRGDNDVATASFDWNAQQITLGDGQVVSISEGAEDMVSMLYQLMQAAQHGEGFVMAVATWRKVERYAFEWLGEEELTLKPGHFHAWHVRLRAESGGKDTTEVWLGREVAGLPIKIRFTDRKGDVLDQVAEEIEYEGQ